MDPNDVNDFLKLQLMKNQLHLETSLQNSSEINYIYLSTASIYKPSLKVIDENSEIFPNKSLSDDEIYQ